MFVQAHTGCPWIILLSLLTVSDSIAATTSHCDPLVRRQPEQACAGEADCIRFPRHTASAVFSLLSRLAIAAEGVERASSGASADGSVQQYRLNRLSPAVKVQLGSLGTIASAGPKSGFNVPEALSYRNPVYLDRYRALASSPPGAANRLGRHLASGAAPMSRSLFE